MDDIKYYLMNKDKVLAELNVQDEYISISNVFDVIPSYIGNVNTWMNTRLSPVGRANIQELLKLAQIKDIDEFLFITRAISLTDTFWVNNTFKPMSWDMVNPFKNRFSRIISNIALNCEYKGGQNLRSPSPEYTLNGSVHKCWKRINNKIYLFKTDALKWNDVTGNRPYCEYYASQIAKALGLIRYTQYGIQSKDTDEGKRAYCYCEIFTNENLGFAPIESTSYKNMTIEELMEHVIRIDTKEAMVIAEMLLLDAIILNIDRHMGNYGFMFNTDNYNIVGMAPIFDNDCSLGFRQSTQTMSFNEAYNNLCKMYPMTCEMTFTEQGKFALRQMHRVKDKTGRSYGQYMLNKLKSIYPFHFTRIKNKDMDVSDSRIQFMEFIVNNQISNIIR